MGRPPIGKTAMTAAERQRRHRAALREAPAVTKPVTEQAVAEPVTKPVTKQDAAEIERLKARIAELEARLANRNDVDRATLSMSAQQRFDAAIRQEKRRLGSEFKQVVQDECRRRIDEIVLPHWREQIAEAQRLYERRRGAMEKATFNKIRRALHPDSRNSISDSVLAEAFDTFMSLEKYLLDEKDSPTDFSGLPNSWAEWEAAKRKETAARRAKRNSRSVARRV